MKNNIFSEQYWFEKEYQDYNSRLSDYILIKCAEIARKNNWSFKMIGDAYVYKGNDVNDKYSEIQDTEIHKLINWGEKNGYSLGFHLFQNDKWVEGSTPLVKLNKPSFASLQIKTIFLNSLDEEKHIKLPENIFWQGKTYKFHGASNTNISHKEEDNFIRIIPYSEKFSAHFYIYSRACYENYSCIAQKPTTYYYKTLDK